MLLNIPIFRSVKGVPPPMRDAEQINCHPTLGNISLVSGIYLFGTWLLPGMEGLAEQSASITVCWSEQGEIV